MRYLCVKYPEIDLEFRARDERGVNVSSSSIILKEITGFTPIMLAVSAGDSNINVVEYMLINNKGKLNVVDPKGNTLLHLAVIYNCPEILKKLINIGKIDPGIRNESGDTAEGLAQKLGHYSMLKYFEKFSADYDKKVEELLKFVEEDKENENKSKSEAEKTQKTGKKKNKNKKKQKNKKPPEEKDANKKSENIRNNAKAKTTNDDLIEIKLNTIEENLEIDLNINHSESVPNSEIIPEEHISSSKTAPEPEKIAKINPPAQISISTNTNPVPQISKHDPILSNPEPLNKKQAENIKKNDSILKKPLNSQTAKVEPLEIIKAEEKPLPKPFKSKKKKQKNTKPEPKPIETHEKEPIKPQINIQTPKQMAIPSNPMPSVEISPPPAPTEEQNIQEPICVEKPLQIAVPAPIKVKGKLKNSYAQTDEKYDGEPENEEMAKILEELAMTRKQARDMIRQYNSIEQELHFTRRNREQAESKLINLISSIRVAKKAENPLLDSVTNMQDLLDLANEELQNKSMLIAQEAKKLEIYDESIFNEFSEKEREEIFALQKKLTTGSN